MKNKTKGKIIKATALGIDVLAPLIATISQFPVWIHKSAEATVSGIFVVFALLSVIPCIKLIKRWLKSPSVTILWCVLAVLFFALRNIIDQMVIICVVGAVANAVGSIVYKSGVAVGDKPDVSGESSSIEV